MNLMNNKGQGISMNVIIIAAIALLVLVILSVLLLRSGGNLGTRTNNECSNTAGAKCVATMAECPGGVTDNGKTCTVGLFCCLTP
ncbi:MAG: hypothetical protein ABIA93_02800 [Candidatus Woesearchaeota archaeon]